MKNKVYITQFLKCAFMFTAFFLMALTGSRLSFADDLSTTLSVTYNDLQKEIKSESFDLILEPNSEAPLNVNLLNHSDESAKIKIIVGDDNTSSNKIVLFEPGKYTIKTMITDSNGDNLELKGNFQITKEGFDAKDVDLFSSNNSDLKKYIEIIAIVDFFLLIIFILFAVIKWDV